MSSADAVRNYKALSSVERAFRSLKTLDLKVRPPSAREPRARAHPPMHARLLCGVPHARRTPGHSFEALPTIVRNPCRVPKTDHTFPMLTIPNDLQLRARELIDKITV